MYTDASDDTCGAQLSQIHNGTKFPVAFLLHMFTDTQRRWSTPEQEAYGIYFAIKKWNYYLQGADIIVRNDHKPLAPFLNGKNENMKINRWGLELASYNITFEWISGAKNCRLPFMTSRTPRETPKEPKQNKTYTDKHSQSSYHQKWNEKNTDRQGNQKTTTTGNDLRQG